MQPAHDFGVKSLLRLTALSAFLAPIAAIAHPGHPGHDFEWDFIGSHVDSIAVFAVLTFAAFQGWRWMKRRGDI
jgi:hypothetical protein